MFVLKNIKIRGGKMLIEHGLLSWMQLYLVCKMKFIFWLTKMYISGDIIDFQWADAIILKNALGGLMSYHWFSQYLVTNINREQKFSRYLLNQLITLLIVHHTSKISFCSTVLAVTTSAVLSHLWLANSHKLRALIQERLLN